MAQLDAEAAAASPAQTRAFRDVAKGYTVFRNGDVLAAKITPCWENGKIGQAKLDHATGVGSTEFHVVRPAPDLDARFVLHFLRQPHVRRAGELRMTGSAGQKRVPAGFLEALELPLLPVPEQRRIAAILDQADALRAKRRQVLAHLDALTQSIFHDMFGESPVATNSLAALADVSSGLTKGRRTSELTTPVPYLAVSNVQAGHLKLDAVKLIDATDAETARYALHYGDLVLTEGGDPDKLGRGTVWRSELPLCLHQNHIFRVRVREREALQPEYLASFMASPSAREYFLRAAKQTTGIASINMTQLKALPVYVPTREAQAAYVTRLEATRRQILATQRALAADDELFASLQSRAFRGEL
jgi:type I restriction enzyme S subunit